ncbi:MULTISPECIES: molybdopterin cofactor-binding domain-containing protein [unclassified Pseudomonas]|uniref:xanthine dehydrogenase family protein molybdopterin-binding subunit n=1 Tax=unclassified Pseudomonas TaxID=196821 RepID=UPI002AC9292E|nr:MULTISPECIES: molybdopterin cofactor-binding domain-containing protein [unclassified Pseudomonas]MEB0041204.1 molybdopterin-dependent oxidoreductase [Pseudomonas sp. MH10]MEB0122790.1 molybdopterin-dependent oxidoreductase [Pseudomonas sp. CCI1.2]WPX66337.1 molybdopterin-dependent oxidoreductase [Pseudomonas sp. MH10]
MRPDDAQDVLSNPGRRHFLVASSLLVSFSLLASSRVFAVTSTTEAGTFTTSTPSLPGSLKTEPNLDAWIKIDGQGQITVFTGKAELGTGIRTALIQIAAEQLDVAPHTLRLITADTAQTPNEGYTAGSHSIADSGTAIFHAAAQVRSLLVQAAAIEWDVDLETLAVKDGIITSFDGRRISYGEVVGRVELHQAASAVSALNDPKTFAVIGQSMPRVDIPGKVTGGPSYVQDMRLPGMLHARVVRAPSIGATLVSLDTREVEKMLGVIKVVRDGNYLAVVADDEWRAILAMRALTAAATWTLGPPLADQATIHQHLINSPIQEIPVADQHGPAAPAVKTVRARYSKPYLTHGSIGPSCAVAHLDRDRLTVWTHTQGVYPMRAGLAEMLSMPLQNIRCVHVEGSGCYGHNGADDVAADAALIARALPGRPVRVQWMREQEHTGEPFGPAMTTEVAASLDAAGKIVDWTFEVWSNTHNFRIANAGRFIPASLLSKPFTPAPPQPIPMPEGDGQRNSVPLYTLPNLRVQYHFLPMMPIRVSAMRSLGAYHNVFSIESFMDELALAANADPVAFRLAHLDDPRGRDVITLAAQKFGWQPGVKLPTGHGVGFAFAQYKNLMAYFAIAMEVSVEPKTGSVQIGRVVAACDCGQLVNPDGARNQIEGGIIQAASWAMFEQTTWNAQNITSYDWSTYPILRFSSVPTSIEVHMIDRPGMPFLGVGEASQGPTSAVIANAIANATGKRLRNTPLTGERLKLALQAPDVHGI